MPKNMRDSAVIVAVVLILASIVLIADAFSAPSEEYVMMSKETFDQIVLMLKVCQGGRI